jgi:hypothetical protein
MPSILPKKTKKPRVQQIGSTKANSAEEDAKHSTCGGQAGEGVWGKSFPPKK